MENKRPITPWLPALLIVIGFIGAIQPARMALAGNLLSARAQTVPTRTPTPDSPPPTDPPPTNPPPPPTNPPPPPTNPAPTDTPSAGSTNTPPPGNTNTPFPTNTAIHTSTPTATPTNTFTPLPQAPTPIGGYVATAQPCGAPNAQSLALVNVRGGPGLNYEVTYEMVYLEVRPIIGRAEPMPWWLVALPNGGQGWVADSVVVVNGNVNNVPIVATGSGDAWNPTSPACPASATSTPIPTSSATPAEAEEATSAPTETPTAVESTPTEKAESGSPTPRANDQTTTPTSPATPGSNNSVDAGNNGSGGGSNAELPTPTDSPATGSDNDGSGEASGSISPAPIGGGEATDQPSREALPTALPLDDETPTQGQASSSLPLIAGIGLMFAGIILFFMRRRGEDEEGQLA